MLSAGKWRQDAEYQGHVSKMQRIFPFIRAVLGGVVGDGAPNSVRYSLQRLGLCGASGYDKPEFGFSGGLRVKKRRRLAVEKRS